MIKLTVYLFVWQITQGSGAYTPSSAYWFNMGEFYGIEKCQKAAEQLGIKSDKFRCIERGQ